MNTSTCVLTRASRAQQAYVEHALRLIHGHGSVDLFGLSARMLLSDPRQHVYIATITERVAGCLIAEVDRDTVLHGLGVVAEIRSRRIAGEIIGGCISRIVLDPAVERLWAAVRPHRSADRERFEQHGFKIEPTHRLTGLVVMMRTTATARTSGSAESHP